MGKDVVGQLLRNEYKRVVGRDLPDYAEDIPEATMYALLNFYEGGYVPGGFLMSVLTNDLFGAVERADAENIKTLTSLVKLIFNHFPMCCQGNASKVEKWMQIRRIERETNLENR